MHKYGVTTTTSQHCNRYNELHSISRPPSTKRNVLMDAPRADRGQRRDGKLARSWGVVQRPRAAGESCAGILLRIDITRTPCSTRRTTSTTATTPTVESLGRASRSPRAIGVLCRGPESVSNHVSQMTVKLVEVESPTVVAITKFADVDREQIITTLNQNNDAKNTADPGQFSEVLGALSSKPVCSIIKACGSSR